MRVSAGLQSSSSGLSLTGSVLLLGGARSGKSRYAEALLANANPRTYIATAEAGDAEMVERIRLHREQRGPGWVTREAPLDLPAAIRAESGVLLVDCLTLWLSNLMEQEHDIDGATEALCAAIQRPGGPVVLVSNEVGLGIVPESSLARAFRDHAGRLHQHVAAVADRVIFIAAGLPLALKGELPK
ncbi:bifunctional adenosylcobinamide kinase/adenosylcobinamide-phosphate guanylyltransferase [Hypericibacter sp.]|uniref:bifunctional adenosylcobinamide kinase/adenosylcobinamide-phosphate guanylyltransferase n=1 Tax=Hypericibacter sp. TaxID=2705401 RepID=UPI003D6D29C0